MSASSFLDALRFDAAMLYKKQEDAGQLLLQNPSAAYRRAYVLSLFRVAMVEATEFEDLKVFQKAFPRLLLPILSLSNEPPSQELRRLVERFLAWARVNAAPKEAFYRVCLWDPLLLQIFGSEKLQPHPGYSIREIASNNANLFIDYAGVYQTPEPMPQAVPLFFVEMSSEPLRPGFSHKDEAKLGYAMTSALLRELSICRKGYREFLEGRRIYGILIGATDIEVCVAFPVFDRAPEKELQKDIRAHTTIVFQNSHKFWRQSLYAPAEGASLAVQVSELNEMWRHCWDGDGCIMWEPPQSKEAVDYLSQKEAQNEILKINNDALNEASDIMAEELQRADAAESMNNAGEKELNKVTGLAVIPEEEEEFSETSDEPAANEPPQRVVSLLRAMLSGAPITINWQCVSLLEFVAKQVERQCTELDEFGRVVGFLPFGDNCKFDAVQVEYMNKSKSTTTGSTPQNQRIRDQRNMDAIRQPKFARIDDQKGAADRGREEHDDPAEKMPADSSREGGEAIANAATEKFRPQIAYRVDDSGAQLIEVTKRNRGYELDVYQHPSVASSDFFPRLFSGALSLDGDLLTLTLERLQKPEEYITHFMRGGNDATKPRRILTKLQLDLMSALRTLHSAGYVHSDVSINNIGYNPVVGTWQLYDFDRSMPIEESRQTKRAGGTTGFVSIHAKETGIFDTLDDYISLHRTWSHIKRAESYSHALFKDVGRMFEIFDCSFSSLRTRGTVNLDEIYLRAFDLYCKAWNCGPDSTDPSYSAGLRFCEEIKGMQAT